MKKQVIKKSIGILGGMGPQASACLLNILIDLSIKEFGAKDGDNFPEIILYSIPVPDFISDSNRKLKAFKMLKKRVIELNKCNVSCLSIACNTAHVLLENLQEVSEAPFISMIDEVARAVDKAQLEKVGILGTPLTIKSKLYQKALGKFNIECIEPGENELEILEKTIRNVIAGCANLNDRDLLLSIADKLKKRGAEGFVLGCTELPLIFPKRKLPVFNSLEILARSLLLNYYK